MIKETTEEDYKDVEKYFNQYDTNEIEEIQEGFTAKVEDQEVEQDGSIAN